MRTFSPVFSSSSVWNFSMGWDWFSASHRAFRFRFVRANGRFCSLQQNTRAVLQLEPRLSPTAPGKDGARSCAPRPDSLLVLLGLRTPELSRAPLPATRGTADLQGGF